MSTPYRKDVGQFIRRAKDHGFHCEGMTGSGHWKLRHAPSGRMMIVAATPNSGTRWQRNAESLMKRIVRENS